MIRLAFIDPEGLLSHIYESLECDHPEVRIDKIYKDWDEALHAPSLARYDILVVSDSMPGDNVLSLIRNINSLTSGSHVESRPKVLVVGSNEGRDEILSYIEAGARGYLKQCDSLREFLMTIQSMHLGQARVSPDLAQALMARLWELANRMNRTPPVKKGISALTPRECEVLQLLKQDLSNNEIAEQLSIEVGTVKNHVHNILDKLEVSSRKHAAEFILEDQRRMYHMQKTPAFAPFD